MICKHCGKESNKYQLCKECFDEFQNGNLCKCKNCDNYYHKGTICNCTKALNNTIEQPYQSEVQKTNKDIRISTFILSLLLIIAIVAIVFLLAKEQYERHNRHKLIIEMNIIKITEKINIPLSKL